jgi:hypothetical protein
MISVSESSSPMPQPAQPLGLAFTQLVGPSNTQIMQDIRSETRDARTFKSAIEDANVNSSGPLKRPSSLLKRILEAK